MQNKDPDPSKAHRYQARFEQAAELAWQRLAAKAAGSSDPAAQSSKSLANLARATQPDTPSKS